MQSDVHPPLYFVLLRLWQDIFGNSDAASRAMSALAGTLTVLVIFDVGRLLNGAATGLWAALLTAIAQPQIIESQDARPYALAILLLLAAADAVVRALRLPSSQSSVLGPQHLFFPLLLAAACLTHYFILPALAALGVFALISHRPRILISFALAGAIVLILWGFGMWQQRHNFSDPWMYWMTDTDPHHVTATLMRFAALPIRFLAEPIGGNANAVAAVVYVLPWLLCKRRPEMVLLGAWLLGCAGLVTILDLARGTNQLVWTPVKYTIFAAPAFYLLLPMIARGFPGHLIAAAAAVFCVMNLPEEYKQADTEYKKVATDLDRLATPDQMVIFCGSGWGEWYTGDLYMAFEHYSQRMPPAIALLKAPLPQELIDDLARRARTTGGLWFVEWTNHPPQELLPGWVIERTVNYQAAVKLYHLMPLQ